MKTRSETTQTARPEFALNITFSINWLALEFWISYLVVIQCFLQKIMTRFKTRLYQNLSTPVEFVHSHPVIGFKTDKL